MARGDEQRNGHRDRHAAEIDVVHQHGDHRAQQQCAVEAQVRFDVGRDIVVVVIMTRSGGVGVFAHGG